MDNMSRLGRSHLFRGVGYFILAPVLFILFRGVFTLMDQGRTAQTPRDPTLVNVAVFIVLSTILYLLYSGCRNFRDYLAVRRAQRLGLRSWRIAESSGGVFHTSEVGSSLAKVIGQLSDEELLAAAHHPDHSLAAKSHFDDALKKRGLSKSVVADWMPAPATLSIGTNIKVTEVGYRSLMLATTVFRGALILLAIAALVIPALFISILAPRSNPFPFLIYTAAVILLFFTCLLIGATATRNRSMRILLLRPFGQRTMTRALKKVVRNKLGNVAHVYTLSDRHYRPNPFLRLWDIVGLIARLVIYLLSPIRRPSICVANVTREADFFRLANTIAAKMKPSWRSLLCGGQAYNIRSTDAWWQRCIDLLMHSSDFILMDISRVSTGSAWEIVQLGKRGLLQRCVFIVQEQYRDDGLKSMRSLLPAGMEPVVHTYDINGFFRDPKAFETEFENNVHSVLSRRHLMAA